MKKSIKNTIMIGMAAVLIGTSAVTYCYAKEVSAPCGMPDSGFSQQMPDGQGRGGQNDFGMFGKDRMNSQNGGSQSGNMPQQPPQQNGDSQSGNASQQPPQQSSDSQSGNASQQPPQQSSDSQSGNASQQPPQQSGDSQSGNASQQPPQQSSDSQSGSESGKPEDTPTSLNTDSAADSQNAAITADRQPSMRKGSTAITVLCYVFLAVQIAIVVLIFIYLVLSKFNKLSFNTVFPEKSKQTK